jgi:hypothetical protein
MLISYINNVLTADGVQLYTHIRFEELVSISMTSSSTSSGFTRVMDDGSLSLDNLIQQSLDNFNNSSTPKMLISTVGNDVISIDKRVVVEFTNYSVCLFTCNDNTASIPSEYQLANINEIANLLSMVHIERGNVRCC